MHSSFQLLAFLPASTCTFTKGATWSIALQTCYGQLSNLLPVKVAISSPTTPPFDAGGYEDGLVDIMTPNDFEQFFLKEEAVGLANAWGLGEADFVSDLEGCDACTFEFVRKLSEEDVASRMVTKTDRRCSFFKNPVNTEKVLGVSKEVLLTPGEDGGPPPAAPQLVGRLVAKSARAWQGSMRAALLEHFNESAEAECNKLFQNELDFDDGSKILVHVKHQFYESSSMFVTRVVALRCEPERRAELDALLQASVQNVDDKQDAGAGGS